MVDEDSMTVIGEVDPEYQCIADLKDIPSPDLSCIFSVSRSDKEMRIIYGNLKGTDNTYEVVDVCIACGTLCEFSCLDTEGFCPLCKIGMMEVGND